MNLKRDHLALGLVLILTAAVYARVAGFDFAGTDDAPYVADNPWVRGGLTPEAIAWSFRSTLMVNWHPLTWLSWMLDQQVYGGPAGGFHLTSLILHLLGTALLYASIRSLTGEGGRAVFVAGLFALHPLHVESVAWISERKDVLSGVFWMLALWTYTIYVRRGRSRGWYAVLLLVFTAGLMAKSMLVTLPFVLLLLDYWPLARIPGATTDTSKITSALSKLVIEKIPLLILAIGFGVLTLRLHVNQNAVGNYPLELRVANGALAYAAYLRDTLWPTNLAYFYPHPGESVRFDLAIPAGLGLIAITGICGAWRRRAPYLAVGWLWFLGVLLPVIGLNDQARADRYTYLPSIGLFIAVAWAVPALFRRRRWPERLLLPLAALTLLSLSVATWNQVSHWRNAETLYRRALEFSPQNVRLLYDLGTLLRKEGRLEESRALLEAAVEVDPGYLVAQINLGVLLLDQREFDRALSRFRIALRLAPKQALVHYNLGLTFKGQRKLDKAVESFERALELEPDLHRAREGLVSAWLGLERTDEAISQLRELIRRNPNHPGAALTLMQLEAESSSLPGPATGP